MVLFGFKNGVFDYKITMFRAKNDIFGANVALFWGKNGAKSHDDLKCNKGRREKQPPPQKNADIEISKKNNNQK